MFKKFKVTHFKSLESVEIELGQVNVFIGANGSGKSNLLESIAVLGAAASGRIDEESLLRRGVRPGLPSLYKSAFKLGKDQQSDQIAFQAVTPTSTYEIAVTNPMDDASIAWEFKSERLLRDALTLVDRNLANSPLNAEQGFAALKSVELLSDDPAGSLLAALRDFAIYCPNTQTLRGLDPDPQNRRPIGLAGGRLAEAVREIRNSKRENVELSENFDEVVSLIDWAENVHSAPAATFPGSQFGSQTKLVLTFKDRFMEKSKNMLTGADVSEGSLYVLFAAALALHPKSPRFFAIDNLDQALNPRLATSLTRYFCQWLLQSNPRRQALVTVHNPAVLDGLPLAEDQVRLFTLDRSNRGHTVVQRVEVNEKLREMGEQGWTLSRLWVMGHLGGVPNV